MNANATITSKSWLQMGFFLFLAFCVFGVAYAQEDAAHKVVIQVSTGDEDVQKMALNNAVNVQKHYGIDNVAIEIVAYGPGLKLLTKRSEYDDRVESLAQQNITFSACQNTINKVKKKYGMTPPLLKGVQVVDAGVVRIMELQNKGYAYVRP